MEDNIFNYLTKEVTLFSDHQNFFLYKETVCKIKCHKFPATKNDYALVSIENDDCNNPYLNIPLINVDHKNLKMLIEVDIDCNA